MTGAADWPLTSDPQAVRHGRDMVDGSLESVDYCAISKITAVVVGAKAAELSSKRQFQYFAGYCCAVSMI